YEYYLCHRTNAMLPPLNQHLHNAAHADKIYCRSCVLYVCDAELGMPSVFCEHVES
ncbi:uncharacterized protein TRAVEDRAFT_105626, partial [Trametes versicolor FP-101664 SS1]|uniref:uncharacterized protein n=1 Tax=Trametes versicolor (strain FP-101664) TaxID=717944 RepID=UPI000462302E